MGVRERYERDWFSLKEFGVERYDVLLVFLNSKEYRMKRQCEWNHENLFSFLKLERV